MKARLMQINQKFIECTDNESVEFWRNLISWKIFIWRIVFVGNEIVGERNFEEKLVLWNSNTEIAHLPKSQQLFLIFFSGVEKIYFFYLWSSLEAD